MAYIDGITRFLHRTDGGAPAVLICSNGKHGSHAEIVLGRGNVPDQATIPDTADTAAVMDR